MKYGIVYDEEPMMLREETIEAIKETRSGEYAGTLDMKDFDSFLKSIRDMKSKSEVRMSILRYY